MRVKTVEEAVKRYGAITPAADGKPAKWADEAKWMVLVDMPAWFTQKVKGLTGQPVKRIYINKDMKDDFLKALNNVVAAKLEDELKTFDGCYSIRNVRGSKDSPSTHTYGLAIDLNAKDNGLGQEPKLTAQLVKCFTDAGFTWGGKFKRKDGMHFSHCWE